MTFDPPERIAIGVGSCNAIRTAYRYINADADARCASSKLLWFTRLRLSVCNRVVQLSRKVCVRARA